MPAKLQSLNQVDQQVVVISNDKKYCHKSLKTVQAEEMTNNREKRLTLVVADFRNQPTQELADYLPA